MYALFVGWPAVDSSVILERFNLDNILAWVHEFTEQTLSLIDDIGIKRLILHGGWAHHVSIAHILSSICTHVGIIDMSNRVFNMDGDTYWTHLITGIPPTFNYTSQGYIEAIRGISEDREDTESG